MLLRLNGFVHNGRKTFDGFSRNVCNITACDSHGRFFHTIQSTPYAIGADIFIDILICLNYILGTCFCWHGHSKPDIVFAWDFSSHRVNCIWESFHWNRNAKHYLIKVTSTPFFFLFTVIVIIIRQTATIWVIHL